MRRQLWILLTAIAFVFAAAYVWRYWRHSPARLVLWAWERPEDLSFVDPQRVEIAYLAATLTLRGSRVIMRPRLQPLLIPPAMRPIAVARIESDPTEPPLLTTEQNGALANEITKIATRPNISAIQIDFDARVSERDFYRALLADLRARLPRPLKLSMTALASWCLFDNWIDELPVDEATPMVFRMGADQESVRTRLNAGADFRARLCQNSVGISLDEPLPHRLKGRTLYIFNPQPWTKSAVARAIEESGK
jgi:hypothetical protein